MEGWKPVISTELNGKKTSPAGELFIRNPTSESAGLGCDETFSVPNASLVVAS